MVTPSLWVRVSFIPSRVLNGILGRKSRICLAVSLRMFHGEEFSCQFQFSVLSWRARRGRCALASAYAHGHYAVARFAALHFVGDRSHHARAGHAEGMADGDRSAVHVQLVHGDAETIAAVDDLHGESFVEFPEIDIVDVKALALEQFGDGKYRADAHLVGFATGDLEAAENQLVRDAECRRRAGATSEAWRKLRRKVERSSLP